MEDLIRKSKIYNYIKAQINPFGKPFEGDVYEFGIKLMEYIEQMDAEESVTDTNVGGKWIPCSERLPENYGNVIACFSTGTVTELLYKGGGLFQGIYEYSTNVIIAWMPLPEPYKGEQHEIN